MATKPVDRDVLLAQAEVAFKQKDYTSTYRYCTELMKGKTASIVVYMQCIASLKLREKSKEAVDTLIDDTLLLAIALDNFYTQSDMQNKNIVGYVQEILFTLLTSLIENVQKHFAYKNSRRSLKQAFTTAQGTIANLRTLQSYDFSRFTVTLPTDLIEYVHETGDKLIAHVSNSINIMKDSNNNWLYEDEITDLYERIINYKAMLERGETTKEDPLQPETFAMDTNEINTFIDDLLTKPKSVANLPMPEHDEIALNPTPKKAPSKPTIQISDDNANNDDDLTTGKAEEIVKPTGQLPDNDTQDKPLPEPEESQKLENDEFELLNFGHESTDELPKSDAFIMPEALDDFSGADSIKPSKLRRSSKRKFKPVDLLIGVLVILFSIAVAYIVMYFL